MDEKLLRQTLNQIADQAVPADYDPRPIVRRKFESRQSLRHRQAKSEIHHPRLRLAAITTMVVLLAAVIFFLTPQGRGFAQQAMRFFTHAESDTLPLPTGQPSEPPHPTRTPAATQMAELTSVTPAAEAPAADSYPTDTPAPQGTVGEPVWNLTIEQAQELAGFEVVVPVSLPPGYRLDNVIFNPNTGEVAQFYEFHPYSAGEMFILGQRLSPPSEVIGQSATVEQLTLGGIPVEYVKGGWFGAPGSSVETWHADAMFHTYHWQAGEFYFSLVFMFDESDTWSPAYWTRDGMLAMIEIVMGVRSEFPEQLNYNNLTSIEQAEAAAGFDILAPAVLPEGFVFTRAVFEPDSGRVLLFYQPEAGSFAVSGVQLLIIESQDTDQPLSWEGYPDSAVVAVQVGSNPATFVRGAVLDGVYDPEASVSLAWSTAALSIHMRYTARPDYPIRLDLEEMLAIAESME